MDRKFLRQLIKGNAQLYEMLQNPKIQQFLHQILEDELIFESLKARFTTSSSNSSQQFGRRNVNNNSAGFQNPNDCPLSPLEVKFIEGRDSEEQTFLRLLFDLIQQS